MITDLRQSFFQVFTVTFVWVTFLLTIFFNDQVVSIHYLWNLVGISTCSACMLGIVYNVLWNYLTLKPMWNILIASLLTITFGLLSVWLFNDQMFAFIIDWVPGMLLLSLILHTLAFFIYAKNEMKKKSEELNRLVNR